MYTQFDNLQLYSSFRACPGAAVPAPGSPVVMSSCLSEVGPHANIMWDFNPSEPMGFNGTFSLKAQPSLCLAAAPADAQGTSWLVLATCAPGEASQVWQWDFEGIAPDNERKSQIKNVGSGGCIDQFGESSDIGEQLDAWACNGGLNQAFWYDWDESAIGNVCSCVVGENFQLAQILGIVNRLVLLHRVVISAARSRICLLC